MLTDDIKDKTKHPPFYKRKTVNKIPENGWHKKYK